MVSVRVRINAKGVVRHGRIMILPTRAAAGRSPTLLVEVAMFDNTKTIIALVSILPGTKIMIPTWYALIKI